MMMNDDHCRNRGTCAACVIIIIITRDNDEEDGDESYNGGCLHIIQKQHRPFNNIAIVSQSVCILAVLHSARA